MPQVDRQCDLKTFTGVALPETCDVAEFDEAALPVGAAETTTAALAEPIDYPPLSDCVTADDRVVVAVARPRGPVLAAALATLDHLVAAGRDPSRLTLLCGWPERPGDATWTAALPCGASLVRRSKSRGDYGFLAEGDDGRAIFLQRTLLDADVVVPVGAASGDPFDDHGVLSVIYPTFSSPAARRRRLDPRLVRSVARRRRLAERMRNVQWLHGVSFAVQALCGPGEQLQGVAAGATDRVAATCRDWAASATWPVAEPYACVVAQAIPRGDEHPWEAIARAAHLASAAVEPDGAIVVTTTTSRSAPRAIRAAAIARDDESLVRPPVPSRASVAAAQLDAAARSARLLLLSSMDYADVEDAGMIPLESVADLERLLARGDRSLILPEAIESVVRTED